MISVQIPDSALEQIRDRLTQLAPGLVSKTYAALRPLIEKALPSTLDKYFYGCGPKGGRTHSLLTSRSSNLFYSVLRSLQMSEDGTNFKLSIGSDLPYAAIHEYGGFAGRPGPFKKKDGRRPYLKPRPYLRPTINDLQQALPALLEQAIQQVQVAE